MAQPRYSRPHESESWDSSLDKGLREELAAICHEIRTPMNIVAGMIDLLMRTDLDAKQQGYLDALKGASEHLLSLMNDVLDSSRIESGKLELDQLPFDLYKLLEANVNALHLQSQLSEFDIYLELGDTVPQHVVGDPRRLNQVLFNLMSNALKYTDQGNITLAAHLEGIEGQEAKVRFSVADTGPGIAPEDQSRILAKYEQGAEARGGTGLGLFISKRLVELMGGEISLHSELGQGANFSFAIDLAIDLHPEADTSLDPDSEENSSNAHILVAEDFPTQRTMITALLEAKGYTVSGAADGQEALDMVSSQLTESGPAPFDLIVMDIQMPRMDGLSAARHIQALFPENTPPIPIVALTGDVLTVDRGLCLEAGMCDYVRKPVHARDLYRAVERNLSGAARCVTEPDRAVDFAKALDLMDGQRDVLMVTCLAVIGNFPIRLVELQEAASSQDWENMRRIAHSFKSTARTLGAETLADTALAMETALTEDRSHDAQTLLTEFEPQVETVINEIERFIQGG
ncbi:MAG: sensor histidine kinase [Desulfovibrio sp.]|nr:MAG: sensor histidine kinase [Desulfovibrio sp.]